MGQRGAKLCLIPEVARHGSLGRDLIALPTKDLRPCRVPVSSSPLRPQDEHPVGPPAALGLCLAPVKPQ